MTFICTRLAPREHRKALTLLELLVVIMILAIISALAIPTVNDG